VGCSVYLLIRYQFRAVVGCQYGQRITISPGKRKVGRPLAVAAAGKKLDFSW